MIGKLVNATVAGSNIGSPAAGDITSAIERTAPLFNLVNGDHSDLRGRRCAVASRP